MFNMVLSNALSTFTTTHSTSSQTKNHSKNETACSFPFCGLNQKADPTHWRQKRSRLTLKRWGSLTLLLVDGRKRGRKKLLFEKNNMRQHSTLCMNTDATDICIKDPENISITFSWWSAESSMNKIWTVLII